ncbi:1-acyl-sn-glycerol-3-phosphate acyltransferase [bacterium]|nr:1-acyl-sn-glycerol-3-phosphate acyltransferase [bacterium]
MAVKNSIPFAIWKFFQISTKIVFGIGNLGKTARRHGPDSEILTKAKKQWADELFELLNMEVQVEGQPFVERRCVYVGNHLSFLDGMVMWKFLELRFLSHSYVGRVPVLGKAIKEMGFILVDRGGSRAARGKAVVELRNAIVEKEQRLMIYPSGKTGLWNQYQWQLGTFKIAARDDVLVQPVMLHFEPLRETAFVDDDSMLQTVWRLARMKEGKAWVKFLKPRHIANPAVDAVAIKEEVDFARSGLLQEAAP